MTNGEIKVFIKMILQILKDSKDKEEAIKKIEELLKMQQFFLHEKQ